MKIELSDNALQIIQNLCDHALKTGGLKNLQTVNALMSEIGSEIAKIEAEVERLEKAAKAGVAKVEAEAKEVAGKAKGLIARVEAVAEHAAEVVREEIRNA